MLTVFRPRIERMSRVRRPRFALSPQLGAESLVAARSNAMMLLERMDCPTWTEIPFATLGAVPALNPDDVGATRTTFASMSFEAFAAEAPATGTAVF
jgi:hypothetical protein